MFAARQLLSRDVVAFAVSMMAGFLAITVIAGYPAISQSSDDVRLRREFKRPDSIPVPAGTRINAEIVTLGERLFNDTRLSANNRIACATCHDMKLGLSDGAQRSTAGVTGKMLLRHTPTLWNVAWAPLLMWDGRGNGLEQQAALPMSHPDEMASGPEPAAQKLASDPDMQRLFAAAFPNSPGVNAQNLVAALAGYERTLVSPPTRFDRWVEGDDTALSDEERLGLSIFAGKGRCMNCHTGFAFTDHGFHDIGMPTTDLGRGPIAGLNAARYSFKTAGLRELAWTAPYMHNGSLSTLEDVVRHYEGGGVSRPSRSKDMPAGLKLTDEERAALVAFLETLSSDTPPRPSDEPWARVGKPPASAELAIGVTRISQKGRQFTPAAIKVRRGERITVLNDDTRTHNVRISSATLDYNSGAQEPGDAIVLQLDRTGVFEAHCGIHPTMRLTIEVE